MNAKIKRRLRRLGVALILIYLAGGIALYFIQDRILFHPKPLAREHRFSFHHAFEETNISLKQNNLSIVKFKSNPHSRGIVLFYHGNRKNVEHYKKYPAFFLRNGYEIWMIDYPGFGKTTGKRTENILYEQALLMYDLALTETSSDHITVYGKSIGTGIASYVAANRNCKQLILETPYYSISSLAKNYFPIYPVKAMIRYSFPVHKYLKEVKAPVTIFHGTKDEIIPYDQSHRLKEEQSQIHLITVNNGKHNNLSESELYQRKIDSLLIN